MGYLTSESGAVTVDWVVLTAGLVGLGLATMAVVSTGVQDTSGDIQDQLQGNDIIVSAFVPDVVYDWGAIDLQAYTSAQFEGSKTSIRNNSDQWALDFMDSRYADIQTRIGNGETLSDSYSLLGVSIDQLRAAKEVLAESGIEHPDDAEMLTTLGDLGIFDA